MKYQPYRVKITGLTISNDRRSAVAFSLTKIVWLIPSVTDAGLMRTLLAEHHHVLTPLGEAAARSVAACRVAVRLGVISPPRSRRPGSRCRPAAGPGTGPASSAVATCTAPSPKTTLLAEHHRGIGVNHCAPNGYPRFFRLNYRRSTNGQTRGPAARVWARISRELLLIGRLCTGGVRRGVSTLGDAGIVLGLPARMGPATRELPTAEEVGPWVKTITALWDDTEWYSELSNRAIVESSRWAPEALKPQYVDLLERLRKSRRSAAGHPPET